MGKNCTKMLGRTALAMGLTASMTATAFATSAGTVSTAFTSTDIFGTAMVVLIFAVLGFKEITKKPGEKSGGGH